MASSQNPSRVFFTNMDRSINDSNTDFTITFDSPIQNAYNFEVVGASFPNLFKPFAPYETIMYIYHSGYAGGAIALGIPMSVKTFKGIGETPKVSGRATDLDGRYFASGGDLATFLNNWLASLDTSYPAANSGYRPFSFSLDDPTKTPNQIATAPITFGNIKFAFDDLATNGSLKMSVSDTSGASVRIASILDYGSLTKLKYPSQFGYKLGFTDLTYEAFGNQVVSIRSPNNILGMTISSYTYHIPIPEDDYTLDGMAAALQSAITSYVDTGVTNAGKIFTGTTVTQSGGILTFNLVTNLVIGAGARLGFWATNDQEIALHTQLGFPTNNIVWATTTPSGTLIAPSLMASQGSVTPAYHNATDPINLTRTSSIYIASSLASGESITSAGRKDILFQVQLTADIGDTQLYQSTLSGIVINRPPNIIRNLRVTFLDDNFQVMEPLPQNAAVNVEIHFSYDQEDRAELDKKATNIYA